MSFKNRSRRNVDDVVEAALTNPLVLHCIFSGLTLTDLKQFRLVNKFWEFEIGCYIRHFRICNFEIGGSKLCSDMTVLCQLRSSLEALYGLISETPFVPIVNSLTIFVSCSNSRLTKTDCEWKGVEFNAELLKQLPLKHLHISDSFNHSDCHGIAFILAMLREKQADLHYLTINLHSTNFGRYFRDGWIPTLTKLKVFELSFINPCKEYLMKVIGGAPNLQKVEGHFHTIHLKGLPRAAYALLKYFNLDIRSPDEALRCLELAEARPALRNLSSRPPSDPKQQRYMASFRYVLEKLMNSSRKTLETLTYNFERRPLKFHPNCPPFSNLKTLHVRTTSEEVDLLGFLGSINYPKCLPSLSMVSVGSNNYLQTTVQVNVMRWLQNDLARHDLLPSESVRTFELWGQFDRRTAQTLRQIYPKLDTILLRESQDEIEPVPLDELWTSLPQLRLISLIFGAGAMRRNMDAEFLGIYPEELEILRELDDDCLHKIQVVPVRPCLLTMTRLRKLEIRLDLYGPDIPNSPSLFTEGLLADQVFLSKVAGIMAFKKMADAGAEITLVVKNAKMGSRLNHLLPFLNIKG